MKRNHKNKNQKIPSYANRSARTHIEQSIKDGKLFERFLTVREDSLNVEDRTVEVVFSAGSEYRQWWGREMLVVDKEACQLDRLNAPFAAFLLNHDKDKQIGTVENARIDNGEALATLRFSRSALGEEIFQDVQDRIRGQISTGYRIVKYEIDESNPKDPLYKITKWQPFEVSIVAYGADPKAVAKRDDYLQPIIEPPEMESEPEPEPEETREETTDMNPKELLKLAREAGLPELGMRAIENDWTKEQLETAIRDAQAEPAPAADPNPTSEPTPAADPNPQAQRAQDPPTNADPPPEAGTRGAGDSDPPTDGDPTSALSNDSANQDSSRVTRIYDLGQEHDERDMAIEAIADPNCSIEEFQARILAKNKENKERAEAELNIPARITIDPKDKRNFRLGSLFHHIASKKTSVRGGLEYEICQDEAQLREKKDIVTEGVPIPQQIFDERSLGIPIASHRILTAGSDPAGGHTIDDELLADSFIDILLEYTAATQRVTRLDDLQGNLIFPRQASRAEAQFVGEIEAADEQDPTFDIVFMSPKHVRAWTRTSATVLHQSSLSVEQFLRRDLARAIAKKMDSVILTGTGQNNQPVGIEGLGSNRLVQEYPDAGLDYDSVLGCEEKLSDEDALMGNLAWIASTKMRKVARRTAELGEGTSRPIWRKNRMIDYDATVTTQVNNDDPHGKAYFANWSEMILGCWGGPDVIVNPYSEDTKGIVRISIGQMCDLGARHVESFCEFKKGS